jgi:hypothetical protein
MGYLSALFSGWLNALGTILTILAFAAYVVSDVGHKNLYVPAPVALLVAVGAFGVVSFRLWRANYSFALAFRESLKDRCDEVTLEWEKLAENYHNSVKKDGQSPTLPNPMDPGWVSYEFKVWPYRVGLLQSSTNTLRRDLKRTDIQVEGWNYSRLSMAELLHALGKCREQILSLHR